MSNIELKAELIPDFIYGDYSFSAEREVDAKVGNLLKVEGTALTDEVNSNNWQIDEADFDAIAEQIKRDKPTLRVDHGDRVYDVVGKITDAYRDKDKKEVKFKGEVFEQPVITRILSNTVNRVSIRGSAEDIVCSECGQRSKPFKNCKCENSHNKVKGTKIKEISFVVDPAYRNTEVKPLGFIASIEKNLEKVKSEVEIEMSKKEVKSATEEKKEEPKVEPKKEEAKVVEPKKEEVKEPEPVEEKKETEAKSMGTGEGSAIALLSKMEAVLSKMEQKLDELTKVKPPEAWTKKDEDEAKKKKDEDEERKKDEDEEKKDEDEDDDEKKELEAKQSGGKVAMVTDENGVTTPAITKELIAEVCAEITRKAKERFPDLDIRG